MSARAFTVFVDEPTLPPAVPLAPAALLAASTTSKENVHPVTGDSADSHSFKGKAGKRKTSVLATKLYAPPVLSDADIDDALDMKAELKKRVALTGGDAQSANKKPRRLASVGRTSSTSVSRRIKALPKVVEESPRKLEVAAGEQATVDAKCYSLTVSPLADISKAFEQVSLDAHLELSENIELTADNSDAAELKQLLSSKPSVATNTAKSIEEPKIFTTPERSRIYKSFTFSSPSPASQRFAAMQNVGVDIFGDIKFNIS